MANEQLMKYTYSVEQGDYIKAGEVSSTIKSQLKQIGIDATLIRGIAIACYEAEMNLVIHSLGGTISLSLSEDGIHLDIVDNGPGIADIDQALMEGFSTAPESARQMGFGAGMGLPNMKRCTDTFSITSKIGVGTTIQMGFKL
jgi:anti-sigma regulatory factor (Ser/Thr protein kinase)